MMWNQSVMDRVLNVKSITSVIIVLIVTMNFAQTDDSTRGNVAVTNFMINETTTTTLQRTESATKMSSSKILSRRKRFIAFPEGSSFSVSF